MEEKAGRDSRVMVGGWQLQLSRVLFLVLDEEKVEPRWKRTCRMLLWQDMIMFQSWWRIGVRVPPLHR